MVLVGHVRPLVHQSDTCAEVEGTDGGSRGSVAVWDPGSEPFGSLVLGEISVCLHEMVLLWEVIFPDG